MFWKKKQVTAAPVIEGTTGVTPSEKKVESPTVVRLPGPRKIPALVEKHLVDNYKVDASIAQILKAAVRKRPETEGTFDCRIFDQSQAAASEVQIKDYTSLDTHPDLILYEGWFDEASKRVELVEKKKMNYDIPLFTEAEIQQKIEALSEAGSTVFFYQARGPALGGPLGQGAAIVELNPNYPGKKGKKYNIYTANVVGLEPVAKKDKLFDSNKPKEIARWIKEAHHKRLY